MKKNTSLRKALILYGIAGFVFGGLVGAYQIACSKFDSPSVIMALAGELAKVVARMVSAQFEAALFFILPISFLLYALLGAIGGLLFGVVWHRLLRANSPPP